MKKTSTTTRGVYAALIMASVGMTSACVAEGASSNGEEEASAHAGANLSAADGYLSLVRLKMFDKKNQDSRVTLDNGIKLWTYMRNENGADTTFIDMDSVYEQKGTIQVKLSVDCGSGSLDPYWEKTIEISAWSKDDDGTKRLYKKRDV
jgi:hypothetical protein